MKLTVSEIAKLYKEYQGLAYVKNQPAYIDCMHNGGANGLFHLDSGKAINAAVQKEVNKEVTKRMREIESIFEYNELEIEPSPETCAAQK